MIFINWIRAVITPFTGLAEFAQVQLVDPCDQALNFFSCVKQKTSFEISLIFVFATHACAGQVRRAHEGDFIINDDGLGISNRSLFTSSSYWSKSSLKRGPGSFA